MNIHKNKKGKYSYNRPKKDITGQKFNKLTVVKWLGFTEVGTSNKRRSVYLCKCECGNFKKVKQTCLKSNNVKSCGCSKLETGGYKGKNYSAISYVFNNYLQSAKRRNYTFSLTRENLKNLIFNNCYYCDEPPSNIVNSKNNKDKVLKYNGIDRKNNNEGYSIDNCVTCCKQCNFLKKDLNHKNFIELILKITNNLKQKI